MKLKKSERFKNNKEIYSYNNRMLENYRNLNSNNIIEIPLENVKLLYQTHINGLSRYSMIGTINYFKRNNKVVDGILIVHKDNDEEGVYDLVSGWRSYVIANALGQKMIKVIVIDMNRNSFKNSIGYVPSYKTILTKDLKAPELFEKTTVNKEKLEEIHTFRIKYHQPFKPIIIDRNNCVVDGYAQFVYNRSVGIQKCQVIRTKKTLGNFVKKQ